MRNKDKLHIGTKRLIAIIIPFMVILFGTVVAVNSAMYYYALNMDYIFGAGEIKISETGASSDWSAIYNEKSEADKESSMSRMKEINASTAAEGIVLLKNRGKILPFSTNERRLNIFGWYFENAPYCIPAGSSSSSGGKYISPREALEESGFSLNTKLLERIREGVPEYSSAPILGRWQNDWAIPEYLPNREEMETAIAFSPVAVVWITRMGTEGADVPQKMNDNAFYHNEKTVNLSAKKKEDYGYNPEKHYLQLTNTEEQLLESVLSAGFEKVVVIVNSDNPMELGFIEKYEEIDAALLVGGMGHEGFKALPKILTGEINPSGRLADTYYANFSLDPTWNNHADLSGAEYTRDGVYFSSDTKLENNVYKNLTPEYIEENGLRGNNEYAGYVFQNYEEGMYLGYRYYETRFGKNESTYTENVVYPFGYGLSYTEFEQYISNYSIKKDKIEVEVCVTNTGEISGKEVVQLYFTAPYGNETQNPNKIEKSAVVLGAFAKTDLLARGEKQTLVLTIDKEQLCSYDDAQEHCYVLDEGNYIFSLRKNSHDIWNFVGGKTSGKQEFIWKNEKREVYGVNNPRPSEKYAHNEIGIKYRAATNAFEQTLAGISPSFRNMSRADFSGTFPEIADAIDQTAGTELIEHFKAYDIAAFNREGDKMPVTGSDNDLQLIDLRGLRYDDPVYEAYLDQWTVEEMVAITAYSGRGIGENVKLGMPVSINSDGTMGIKYKSVDSQTYGTILPLNCTACTLARTWNVELCERLGEVCGEEALQFGMNGWYAPALNLHRSPLSGRYFDYFSEDPLLSGKLGAAICTGAGKKGVVTYLKHFAMNEGEYLRNYCSVWATEQVMRELYLKPFEIAIKESSMTVRYYDESGKYLESTTSAVHGIMSSFNRVGNTWAGGNRELLVTVLREEWGFNGVVITDNMRTEWTDMNPDVMLRGGGTICLSGRPKEYEDTQSASAVLALRKAVHDIAYTVANSNAMNGIAPGAVISYGLSPWEKGLIVADTITAVIIVGLIIFLVVRYKDEKKHPERYDRFSKI